jgi:protease I
MAKILIITGDAAESLEVMYPCQRLLEEGYEVDIAAPSAKKLQFVVHDFVGRSCAPRHRRNRYVRPSAL